VGSFILWLAISVPIVVFQDQIVTNYKIGNPVALWLTLLLGLASLWAPMIYGTLQGMQDFLWFGWAYIVNGLARLAIVAFVVLLLGGYAAGAISGALLGMGVAIAIGVWRTWRYWIGPAQHFEWIPWIKRLLPLTLGFGVVIYMMSLDMIAVQRFYPDSETGFYGAAGMVGRAIYFFTAPLAAVMFPKVVQSAAKSEKTDVLMLALGVTALMGAGAALGCTVLPRLPLLIVFGPEYLKIAPLVPAFAWCMVPLTLSSVLINNLLAREKHGVVPWLMAIAAVYFFAVHHVAELHGTVLRTSDPWLDQVLVRDAIAADFAPVVKTLGFFNILMLAVCLLFTWLERHKPGSSEPQAVATA
jgi:O-antigen/teichoic acid export membrane protein